MKRRWLIGVYLLAFVSLPANAFYQWQSDETEFELRGLVRLMVFSTDYPAELNVADETDAGLVGRVIGKLTTPGLSFETHAYQTWLPISPLAQRNNTGQLTVERSGGLERNSSHDHIAVQVLDRLSLRWASEKVDIQIGRQPINLATTFFFSPNDLFAPFAAESFYRVYKPGVDAVRMEVQLSELSQLSLISVLGYRLDAQNSNGWSDDVDSQRHSYLLRMTSNYAGLEWGLMLGKVRRSRIQGLSLQGELFDWLGLRAEGHRAEALDSGNTVNEFTIGLEHRWANSLFLQIEQFYHGDGAAQVTHYELLNQKSPYLGRRYMATGLSYEFSPLLTGQLSLIRNLIDQSYLLAMYFQYSLSDESELAISLNHANGKKNSITTQQSEYGSLPDSLSIEWRHYF